MMIIKPVKVSFSLLYCPLQYFQSVLLKGPTCIFLHAFYHSDPSIVFESHPSNCDFVLLKLLTLLSIIAFHSPKVFLTQYFFLQWQANLAVIFLVFEKKVSLLLNGVKRFVVIILPLICFFLLHFFVTIMLETNSFFFCFIADLRLSEQFSNSFLAIDLWKKVCSYDNNQNCKKLRFTQV